MKIQNKELDEFISIYKDEFGEELDRAQALGVASDLLRLYEALASQRPLEMIDSQASEDGSKKA